MWKCSFVWNTWFPSSFCSKQLQFNRPWDKLRNTRPLTVCTWMSMGWLTGSWPLKMTGQNANSLFNCILQIELLIVDHGYYSLQVKVHPPKPSHLQVWWAMQTTETQATVSSPRTEQQQQPNRNQNHNQPTKQAIQQWSSNQTSQENQRWQQGSCVHRPDLYPASRGPRRQPGRHLKNSCQGYSSLHRLQRWENWYSSIFTRTIVIYTVTMAIYSIHTIDSLLVVCSIHT